MYRIIIKHSTATSLPSVFELLKIGNISIVGFLKLEEIKTSFNSTVVVNDNKIVL